MGLSKKILVYNLNGRDTSIIRSKHGYSSKYLKSDSNITGAITNVEHHRDTIIDLRTFGIKYPCNVIIGHLNINSIRNKFELLWFLNDRKVNIFLISETKIDGTFPASLFLMSGYSNVYQLDWNDKGGRIMLFVKGNLSCKWLLFFRKNRDILGRIKPKETEMIDILLLKSS